MRHFNHAQITSFKCQLTWWCIQWMIDKITNKDTITSVKQRQMDKDKSLLGTTDIVFVFMG